MSFLHRFNIDFEKYHKKCWPRKPLKQNEMGLWIIGVTRYLLKWLGGIRDNHKKKCDLSMYQKIGVGVFYAVL